jgi:hypothetical protein
MQVSELGRPDIKVEITHNDVICISHAVGVNRKADIILWLNDDARERLGLASGLTVSPLGYIATLLELLADQANAKQQSKTNKFLAAIKADYLACVEWFKNVIK